MPVNKNAIIRYQIINRCLTSRTKKAWSTKELIKKLAEHDIIINARMLRYDISTMRNDDRLRYFAPIKYSKTDRGYFYTDPNYSIDVPNLSEEQLQSFDTVINFLHEYQDLHVMSQFRGAIDKLAGLFSQVRSPADTSYIEFEKAPYYKGIEWRDQLLEMIRKKQVVSIKYTTFGRSYPIKHILHPYLLKEYKNRWYLVGLLHSKLKPITLALDRINAFTSTDEIFLENIYFDPREYFSNFLGISCTDGAVEDIVIKCSTSLANYIKTQHIHTSQQIIKEDKNGIIIQLKLIPNYELISLILGYGKDMQVLKPKSLVELVKKNIEENLSLYA